MPTYDYVCEHCGNRFEEWQKITDEPIKACPTCGGPVHRVIYPVGLVFKGSGFYKTDNRAAPPTEATEAGTGTDRKVAAPESGGGAETSTSDAAGVSKDSSAAPAGAAAKSE